MGFRCIIAPSFADIFYNNCIQNGMLPVVLAEEKVDYLLRAAQDRPGYQLTVDLEEQLVHDGEGFRERFEIDPFVRERLLNGLDDIGLTLTVEDAIARFESRRPRWLEIAAD
jgi:3-isopropylmalate/(R)-2-methylmalate dehydratase small subunit